MVMGAISAITSMNTAIGISSRSGRQLPSSSGSVEPKTNPKKRSEVYEYDPTGEYTYKHQNPKFKEA